VGVLTRHSLCESSLDSLADYFDPAKMGLSVCNLKAVVKNLSEPLVESAWATARLYRSDCALVDLLGSCFYPWVSP